MIEYFAHCLLKLYEGLSILTSLFDIQAFHLWHTSCLLHWILLCESETWSQAANVETSTGGQKAKRSEENYISILCPACQGTGKNMEGDALEQPTVSIKKVGFYRYSVSRFFPSDAFLPSFCTHLQSLIHTG